MIDSSFNLEQNRQRIGARPDEFNVLVQVNHIKPVIVKQPPFGICRIKE
jgi:hypothetical protein